ncbi:endo-1,4-beta-xylanase [Planctomycetota bacterium]
MIRFRAFRNQKQINRSFLNGAYLFAQDEIPVRSQLRFEKNELLVIRHNETAVGLANLWEVPDFGKIFLQTTRLPERDKPYNLNLEIARARLLRISQKREDWGLTEQEIAKDYQQHIEESLEKFVEALCLMEEPGKAAQLADESLSLSMWGGEEMTLAHARMFLERRANGQGFGRHSFGCTFDPNRIQDKNYCKFVKNNFHFITVPISWKKIEPKEQELDFELLDECVNWLSQNRIAVKVGPLVNFSPSAVPDWLYIWEHDFEQVRESAYEYITRVVERYGRKVQAWDVVSGMNADNCFKFSFEQIIEMTRSAALAAKRASARSLALVELTEPWGEYYAVNQRTIPPLIYADIVCQGGVPFDGFGIKIRFGRGGGGMRTRDLLELSHLLDRFGVFGKPLHLTDVQVPSQPNKHDGNGKISEAGHWREEWNEQIQAQWLEQVYQVALSKHFVETITWGELVDREDGILQHGGLLKQDLTPKKAFDTVHKLQEELVRSDRDIVAK